MIAPERKDPQVAISRRGALVALIFILALVLVALFVVHVLRNTSNLQDCVMQGRTNCAPVDSAAPGR